MKPIKALVMERHTTSTARWYDLPDPQGGKPQSFPSVTTVLGNTQTAAKAKVLENWRKRVGHEEAERIRKEASERGTRLHAEVEAWLEDPFRDPDPPKGSVWFNGLRPFLAKIDEPLLVEGPVWHSAGFAGTVDLVAVSRRGNAAVIDWKTSNSTNGRKPREWLLDYELQVAAYTAAVRERYQIELEQAHVVVAYDDGKPADIFSLDAARLRQMWSGFLARLAQYKAQPDIEPWEHPNAYDEPPDGNERGSP